MQVTYLDHMGDDATIVNAARVSFGKKTKKDWQLVETPKEDGSIFYQHVKKLPDKDVGLLNFLARHKHESPFAHTSVQFHFKAPIFVARQLAKHQIGFSWNEISRRYVDAEPEFYWPDKWRKRAENVKQGSSQETIAFGDDTGHFIEEPVPFDCTAVITLGQYKTYSRGLYKALLGVGVCPEQARMVLPQNMMTEWIWTGSLLAWARVWHLRTKKDAQQETREVVRQIDEPLTKLFPEAWKVLKKWKPVMVEDVG